jgi:hypothetical protein
MSNTRELPAASTIVVRAFAPTMSTFSVMESWPSVST